MSSEFKCSSLSVNEVFKDENIFRVPPYQRPYSWKSEHAEILLDDLLDAMNASENSKETENLDHYFLGSILLIKNQAGEFEIVDGQQRLITLTILLSVIRGSLTDKNMQAAITKRIKREKDLMVSTSSKEAYRLVIRNCDQNFFKDYIQSEDFGVNKPETDGQRKIKENADLFKNRLSDLGEDCNENLARFVLNNCRLIVIEAHNVHYAYRLFSILNDRGLSLSASDILKSEFFEKIEVSKRADYARKWEEIEGDISHEGLSNLFSHIRMIKKKAKPKNSLLEDFKAFIWGASDDESNAAKFFDKEVYPAYLAYAEILACEFDSTRFDNNVEKFKKEKEAINEHLRWLSRLEFNDWVPPSIKFMLEHRDDTEKILMFFKNMERLSYGLMLIKTTINKRIEFFSAITESIEDGEDIFCEDSPLELLDHEKSEVLAVLKGDIYNLPAKTRSTLLLRLDSLLSEGEASYKHDVTTIEHVLPQNPKQKSQWLKWFPRKIQREKLVHCLGNLVLLTKKRNSQASNLEFSEKKEKYFKSNKGVVSFALTTEVINHEEWTPDVIIKRQEKLVKALAEHWRLYD